MLEQLSKLDGGENGNQEVRREGLAYPPHIKSRLDKALAQIEVAETDETKMAAMEEYGKEMEWVRAEYASRMELTEFKGDQIQKFELWAIEMIIEEINKDYARRRVADPDFEIEDISVDDLNIHVEEDNVVGIVLYDKKLTSVPVAVGKLVNLKQLILGANQITVIENLSSLVNLQVLHLTHNAITEISGLDTLVGLKKLELSCNQIKEIKGLESLINLKTLLLDDNQISEIKGLDTLTNLSTLALFANRIDLDANEEKIQELRSRLTGRKRLIIKKRKI